MRYINRSIPRRGNNTFFSGRLSTGTVPGVNFDLVKCIKKLNIPIFYTYKL